MAKLPFVVEPRLKPVIELVGSEDSGQIEIERKGHLSAGEKAFVSNGLASDPTSEMMFALMRRVAAKYTIDTEEAYQLIHGVLTGSSDDELAQKLRIDFTTEIGEITMAAVAGQSRGDFIKAYCMLLYRVDGSLSAQDVMEQHPDILADLVKLYNDEESKSTERLLEAVQASDTQSEEAAKK